MRAMAVAGWHSAIQSGLERGRAWAWAKGATGIRKEVVEEQSSILLLWRHASTLARAQRRERQKLENGQGPGR